MPRSRKTIKRRRSRSLTARQRGGLSNPFRNKRTNAQKAANKAASNAKAATAKKAANNKAAAAKALANLTAKQKSNSLRIRGKKSLEGKAADAAKKKAEESAKVAVDKAAAANKAIVAVQKAAIAEKEAIEKYKNKYSIQSNNIANISEAIPGVFERRKFTSLINAVTSSEKAAETAIKAVDDANRKAANDAVLYETAVNTAFAADSTSPIGSFNRIEQHHKNSATTFKGEQMLKVNNDVRQLRIALAAASSGSPAPVATPAVAAAPAAAPVATPAPVATSASVATPASVATVATPAVAPVAAATPAPVANTNNSLLNFFSAAPSAAAPVPAQSQAEQNMQGLFNAPARGRSNSANTQMTALGANNSNIMARGKARYAEIQKYMNSANAAAPNIAALAPTSHETGCLAKYDNCKKVKATNAFITGTNSSATAPQLPSIYGNNMAGGRRTRKSKNVKKYRKRNTRR